MRLDRALVERGLVRSRAEAQSLIAARSVLINGCAADKSSQAITDDTELEVRGERCPYVSRGGWKLQAALEEFAVSVAGRTALDVGSSTGGFTDCLLRRGIGTDCLLRRGIGRVVAIDVGHRQMSSIIKADPRVALREGINARSLRPQDFDAPFDLIVVDLSFISLRLVLPALTALLSRSGDLLCLVKPQFEVGAQALGKGGIVRDKAAQENAVVAVIGSATTSGLALRGKIDSPILGSAGNREFLVWFQQAAGTPATREE